MWFVCEVSCVVRYRASVDAGESEGFIDNQESEREVLTKASCVWFVCVVRVCVQPTSTVSPS